MLERSRVGTARLQGHGVARQNAVAGVLQSANVALPLEHRNRAPAVFGLTLSIAQADFPAVWELLIRAVDNLPTPGRLSYFAAASDGFSFSFDGLSLSSSASASIGRNLIAPIFGQHLKYSVE
jgi:hypothetical protein